MNQEQQPASRLKKLMPIAIPVVIFLVVFIWPLWSIFGTSVMHNIENPETTVHSRSDIDELPPQVNRLAAPTLNDNDLEYLASKVSVTELNLGDNRNFTDVGLKHVAKLKGLEHLSMDRTNVTDAGIKHLRKVPLVYINLWHTRIGDRSLGYVAEMGTMKQLQIKGCSAVTDKGVAKLSSLNQLWMVNLSGCNKITDKSVKTLSDMPSVNFIQVFDCPKVSDAAVNDFLSAQPNRTLHR